MAPAVKPAEGPAEPPAASAPSPSLARGWGHATTPRRMGDNNRAAAAAVGETGTGVAADGCICGELACGAGIGAVGAADGAAAAAGSPAATASVVE
jgi:hypothetical protein